MVVVRPSIDVNPYLTLLRLQPRPTDAKRVEPLVMLTISPPQTRLCLHIHYLWYSANAADREWRGVNAMWGMIMPLTSALRAPADGW